jgi:endonuclease/exonuclease/phosphatase family metal-dependent hydrolase
MRKFILFIFLLSFPRILFPQALPITIDGEFDDWEQASLLFEAEHSAINPEFIHVNRIWGANDNRFLFLRIQIDREITLLENNPVVLFLNTDNDNATGFASGSIGAELRWEFGQRQGVFYNTSTEHTVYFRDIRLRTAPTVTSTEFEIAIGRDAYPAGDAQLFQSDTIQIYIHFDQPGNQHSAYGEYIFNPNFVSPPDPIPLERYEENDLRILGFNAWNDNIFNRAYTNQYRRILEAIDPDIIAFQEIWDHSAEETAERVEELLPGGNDFQWYAEKKDRGNVTVSRFPILDARQILVWKETGWSDEHRLTATIIDTDKKNGSKLLLVNVHLRAGSGGEANRWLEIDALKNFVHNARKPGGWIYLEDPTPIILVGDFNLVGSRGQLEAIERDLPDWDGSGFDRVRARQTEKRMHYTWRNDNSGFSPGKLDYIFYTGSVLSLQNHYTLQGEEMSTEQRTLYGLQYGDTQIASDHLPHVADFRLMPPVGVKDTSYIEGYALEHNYPNPFNPSTTISFSIPESGNVTLTLYNVLGVKVKEIFNSYTVPGQYRIEIDASDFASGLYYYTMQAGNYVETKSMVLVR